MEGVRGEVERRAGEVEERERRVEAREREAAVSVVAGRKGAGAGAGRSGSSVALASAQPARGPTPASTHYSATPQRLWASWISSIAIHDAASVFPMTHYTQRLQMINFAQSLCRCLLS